MRRFALLAFLFCSAVPAQPLQQVCGACHQSQAEDFGTHPHAGKALSCDACHGASEPHRNAGGATSPDRVAGPGEQAALCGGCHAGQAKAFEKSRHGVLVRERSGPRAPACTGCHGSHLSRAPAFVEQQCKRCHEMPPASCSAKPSSSAARVACANCHEKHALTAAKR